MLQPANEAANQVYWTVENRITDYIYNPIIEDLKKAGIRYLIIDGKYHHPPMFSHVYERDQSNTILKTIKVNLQFILKNI